MEIQVLIPLLVDYPFRGISHQSLPIQGTSLNPSSSGLPIPGFEAHFYDEEKVIVLIPLLVDYPFRELFLQHLNLLILTPSIEQKTRFARASFRSFFGIIL